MINQENKNFLDFLRIIKYNRKNEKEQEVKINFNFGLRKDDTKNESNRDQRKIFKLF